ncbi:hypothetical protein GCM10009557_48270 [Virgisporangium ochraceum]
MARPVWGNRLRPVRLVPTGTSAEETAAGIYGIIVGAAVMAASHAPSAVRMVVAVLVTLTVYWSAERFARLVAERIHEGRRPDRREVLRQLTTGWELVSASWFPLFALVVARLAGWSLETAVTVGLGCSTMVLCLAGWEMGRNGQLTTLERLVTATVAGMFGVLMIVLKTLLH